MLFDKREKPVLSGLDEEYDWDACEAYKDWVYSSTSAYSDDEFSVVVQSVRDVYAEYYALYES